jgi:molecular chaperone DnaK (HSP70)
LPFRDREVYVIIDANPDFIEVAVITPEQESGMDSDPRSKILGRASAEFGGQCTDSWVADEILSEAGGFFSDDRLSPISNVLRLRCRMGREALSSTDEVSVRIGDLLTGRPDCRDLTRSDIARIFREHGLFKLLDRTISRAVSAARMYGYDSESITAVLMIGELSLFPPLYESVCVQFPSGDVRHDHALDAGARGAASTDTPKTSRIREDFALRYWDPVSAEHRYRLLVRRGTAFPSAGQVARILISAAYDGQTQLGIPLYRISGDEENTPMKGLELVGTIDGGFRLAGPVNDCGNSCRPVMVNKAEPTYLSASPPAQKGVPRFELTFTVDENGCLCLSARDLMTGLLVKNAWRMHRLI